MTTGDVAERRERRMEGSEEHERIWTATVRPTRFPSRRIRRGLSHAGVQATLDKPHGLKPLMQEALRLVGALGLRRWEPVVRRLSRIGPPEQALETLDILVGAGVFAVHERNRRPHRGEYWEPAEIELDLRARREVDSLHPPRAQPADTRLHVAAEVEGIRRTWIGSGNPLCPKLEAIVQAGIQQLREPDVEDDFPVPARSIVRYRSVLLALAYARRLLGAGETMPLRTLSVQIWQNSKVLDRYRDDIARTAGVSLGRIGLTTHPDTLWAYGDVLCRLPEPQGSLSLLVGRPPILAEDTALMSEFRPGDHLGAILFVENLTVFLEVLTRVYYGRPDVLVIWSGGYPGRIHRRLLREVLRQRQVPVYVWADIDGDGLAIAHQITQWVTREDSVAEPLLMGEAEWRLGNELRQAGDRDVALTGNTDIQRLFPEVAALIAHERRTVEQEALLAHWEWVQARLP